jgi:hypothetical protein
MLSVYPSVGRDWTHELAGFRLPASPVELIGRPFWSALEASDGRDCEFGSIRWPRLWNGAGRRPETKLLINVLFHVKVYVCHRAHVQEGRRMKRQMTSGGGSWSRSGTFGLLRTARCRFVRVRACGPTAQPAPRAKAIAATCSTVAAVGNAFRSMCPKNSWRISSWPWRTDVVSRI